MMVPVPQQVDIIRINSTPSNHQENNVESDLLNILPPLLVQRLSSNASSLHVDVHEMKEPMPMSSAPFQSIFQSAETRPFDLAQTQPTQQQLEIIESQSEVSFSKRSAKKQESKVQEHVPVVTHMSPELALNSE